MADFSEHALDFQPDFNALFHALPSAYLVMSPDFTIVAVNDAYLQATGAKREKILGRGIFEAFPGNPGSDGVEEVRASLMRALKNKTPDTMPVQRYDVLSEGETDGFSERYWKPIHIPVLNREGEVAHIVQYIGDMTKVVQTDAAVTELRSEVFAQVQEIRDRQYFEELFQQTPTFMAMLAGPNHRVELANPSYLKLIGRYDIVGKSITDALPEAAAQGYLHILDEVYQTGKPYTAVGAKFVFQSFRDGPADERYVDFAYQPIRNRDGKIRGVFVQGADVTSRVQTEKRRDALVKLTDVLRDQRTPEDVIFRASEILGQTLGASRVGYGTMDAEAERLHVARDWCAPGVLTLVGTVDLREYGTFVDDMKLGRLVAISDVETDPRTREAVAALRQRSAGSFVNVPIVEHGQLVAAIFVNNAQARNWTPDDLAFIREFAERTRTASERLRSEIAMRLSEAKFRTIANAMPQMVWATLPDGYHDYFNQQWYDYTGVALGETDGEGWNAMFHPEDQEYAWQRWQHSLATGETYEIQYRLRHHSGEYRWVLGRALPIRDDSGTIVRWMGTCTDIHEQKLSEDEWKQASQRKDEFLAMLAHELRNPLAPISTAAQLLAMQGANENLVRQASDIINRQVKHMADLVDDLLDVSRVTRGLVQLDKEDLDLKAVIHNAIEQARPLLEARHHELLLRIPSAQAYVHGDKTRLVQAIANLLNNAAKYTPQRGEIALALEVQKTQVKIRVSDNGIGMAPELIPQVFALFAQAERTPDRAQGGLGLGLALVKSICSLHGGNVFATSEGLGKGSTFTIILPLIKPQKATVIATPSEKVVGTCRPLRLMIVDDNRDAALSLAALLEAAGHHVTVFEDAESALNAAENESVQAFILDIGLPDMDGYELARRLRSHPGTADKVLIALTGYGQAHDRILSKAAGFDHHFVKPIDTVQLSHILSSIREP